MIFINEISGGHLILLDKVNYLHQKKLWYRLQNFERDIFLALKEALSHLSKCQTLKIVFLNILITPTKF